MPSIKLQQDNPKREGTASWDRYERYKAATTLEEFLSLGGWRADYKHDLNKGFIEVLDGGDEDEDLRASPKWKKEKKAKRFRRDSNNKAYDEDDDDDEDKEVSLEALKAKVVSGVERVLTNITEGLSPEPLAAAWVCFVKKDPALPGAVAVVVAKDEAAADDDPRGADVRLLENLCDFGGEDLLVEVPRRGADVAQQVPALLETALDQDLVRPEDVPRLTRKFSVWFEGVRWSETVMTPQNRPGMADWAGWPWEADRIMTQKNGCLDDGLPADGSVRVIVDKAPDEDERYNEMLAARFIKIWAEGEGSLCTVAEAVDRAYAQRYSAKRKKKVAKKAMVHDEDDDGGA